MLKDIDIPYTYDEDGISITKGYVGSDIKKVKNLYQDMLNDLEGWKNNEIENDVKSQDDISNFYIDMVHNMEELAELQKEISKWVRGTPRMVKLEKGIMDVRIAIDNIEKWIKERF
jgi:hypothetical protein